MRNKNIKNYHFCNFCTTYKNVKPDLSVYWIDRKLIGRFQKVGCVVSANSESDDIDMQIVQNKFHTYLCRYNWKVLSLKTLLPSFLCNCIPSTSTIYVRELSVFTPRANARTGIASRTRDSIFYKLSSESRPWASYLSGTARRFPSSPEFHRHHLLLSSAFMCSCNAY